MLNKLTKLYHSKLFNAPFALRYVWDRGIFTKTIKHFQVGYCSRNIGYEYIASRYHPSVIEKSGIFYKKQDKFNKRIVFPLMENGETKYFTSRLIADGPKPHLHQSGSIPIFFNHDALKEDTIIIVESPIDCMTLHQNYFPAIATLGIMGNLKNHTNKFQDKKIYIAYDFDTNKSGQRGAIRIGRILSRANIDSFIVKFPSNGGKVDANSFFKDHDAKDFEKLMRDAVPYFRTEDSKKQTRQYNTGMFPIQIIAEDYDLEMKMTTYGAQCVCKFHLDTAPSLSLYFSTQSFYCFGCHVGGDAVRFYQLLQKEKGRYITRDDAVEELKKKY